MHRDVIIFDTTLRDGEQAPGNAMTPDSKLRLARQLDALGVDVIEAGFPASSNGDFAAVNAIAKAIKNSTVCALARANENDVRRAGDALKGAKSGRLHMFLASSPIHMKMKLRMTPEQVLAQAVKSIGWAREYTDNIEFSPEDAGRSEPDFLCKLVEASIAAGATTINIPDTVGYTMPWQFGELIKNLRERVPNSDKAVWSVHCHNDLGMAVANSVAAVMNGARQVECTINGLGERAGNASLEEIVMAMRVRQERYPYVTGVVSEQLFPASQLLTEITQVPVQPNKAVIGRNAFAHEAGIHQDGMLKNPLTYEIMTPQSVGVPDSRLVLGKHSGRHALGLHCEKLGYLFDRRELDEVYRRFVVLADRIKNVEDHHLLQLIRDTKDQAVRMPPAHVETTPLAIASSATGATNRPQVAKPFPGPRPAERQDGKLPLHPMAEPHYEEDYLWGV